MLFIILLFAVALLVASPYLLIVRKRAKMLKRITVIARRSGFRTKKLHSFVCFSLNRAPRYDLLFESRSYAFAVKLWSATKKNGTLFIRGNGTAFESSKVPAALNTETSAEHTVNGRARRVPVTKNNFKVKKGKPVICVMLYYPSCEKVILNLGRTNRKLSSGDGVFDKILCSPSYFEKMLAENASQRATEIAVSSQKQEVNEL